MKPAIVSFEMQRIENILELLERLAGGETEIRIPFSENRDHLDAIAYGVNSIAQELVFLKEAAEAANREKSQFLAMMSHEIRTPLSAILGLCELLGEDEFYARRGEFLERIRTSGKLLRSIVDDVLDLTKIESGKMQIQWEQVFVRELIRDVVGALELSARNKGLEIKFSISERVPQSIKADPTRLGQILTNVIANGIKFTERGRISIEASLTVNERGMEWLEVRITDTGIGIDSENQKKLFQAFRQADEKVFQNFGGTGLGLALSKHFAKLMQGDLVLLQSSRGEGSTFLISLPAADCGVAPLAKNQAGEPLSAIQRLLGVRVLLAEDFPELRFLYEQFLEAEGAIVVSVGNGFEALDAFECQDFDSILMDVNMPKMGGLTAVRKLRAQGCKLPIVALTGNVLRGQEQECLAAGYTCMLTKPFFREELIRTLLTYLPEGQKSSPS